MELADGIIFRERQRLWWGFIALMIVCCAAAAGFFAWAMVRQLAFGAPVGDRPMSDTVLAILGPVVIIAAGAGLLAAFATRLIVEVRDEGLYVRFAPLHRRTRRIPLEQVTSVRAVTYRPILEYGGWGIRRTRRGKAYSACGNRGVRLDYADGRHLLIGSRRPEALAGIIRETFGLASTVP